NIFFCVYACAIHHAIFYHDCFIPLDNTRGQGFRGGRGFRGGSRGSFRGGSGKSFDNRNNSFSGGNDSRGRGSFRGGSRGRGGSGGGGFRGASRVFVEPHRHEGVFVIRGKEDALATLNMVQGESVYKEKRISVPDPLDESKKIEYRIWNPFRSKLAAGILGGLDNIYIKPGTHVLYLGAASGTTANCVDSTAEPVAVFAEEVKKLAQDKLKPLEQITLEPYERDHAIVVGVY
ncbi:hypothetical protein HZS_8127, partial [Henneguya salminicola]